MSRSLGQASKFWPSRLHQWPSYKESNFQNGLSENWYIIKLMDPRELTLVNNEHTHKNPPFKMFRPQTQWRRLTPKTFLYGLWLIVSVCGGATRSLTFIWHCTAVWFESPLGERVSLSHVTIHLFSRCTLISVLRLKLIWLFSYKLIRHSFQTFLWWARATTVQEYCGVMVRTSDDSSLHCI